MTTEDYAFAEAEFHHYKHALAAYAERLSEAAALLRTATDRLAGSGIGLGPALSARAPGEPALIDGRALPRADDIQRMLVAYHGAYDRLCTTWDSLPPPARRALRPPPPNLPTLLPAGA